MNETVLRELQQGPPAGVPRPAAGTARLLLLDAASGEYADRHIADLADLLAPGDLLVLNDAATLPGSLRGLGPRGEPIELRLTGQSTPPRWTAVLFGAGDWRVPTERRPPAPALRLGDALSFGDGEERLTARVAARSARSPRLLEVEFDRSGEALFRALYHWGRPVQYSYLQKDLDLWDVQNAYASRPWAAEQPSAGRPLRFGVLLALIRRGVEVCTLTHAAGLSSSGDPELDAALPLPERYDLPERTVEAVSRALARGRRVVAVGTSVARALEGNAAQHGGVLHSGADETGLLIGPGFRPQVVDALLTGLHDPVGTHFALLQAFASRPQLERAYRHAQEAGYLWHELGDSMLILGPRPGAAPLAP
jgi:S-adenosylmethionine:tRNA ribosyltransferase-isomerase